MKLTILNNGSVVDKVINFERGQAYGILIPDTLYCPNCDENFDIDYNRYEYCPQRGQAIENSELDERM